MCQQHQLLWFERNSGEIRKFRESRKLGKSRKFRENQEIQGKAGNLVKFSPRVCKLCRVLDSCVVWISWDKLGIPEGPLDVPKSLFWDAQSPVTPHRLTHEDEPPLAPVPPLSSPRSLFPVSLPQLQPGSLLCL